MNPKLVISNYFDSLINQIDIYTEKQLTKFTETDLIETEKPFKFEEYNQTRFYEYGFSHQPSRNLLPGTVRVLEFLNTTREKLIAEVNSAQVEAFKHSDEIKDELKVISKDETKSQEERDEEIKRKVFATKFIGLVQIKSVKIRFDKIINNTSPFKLYLVELDYYMDQYERFLFSQSRQMDLFLVGELFFDKKIKFSKESTFSYQLLLDNHKLSLNKAALRAILLREYLLGVAIHQDFLNTVTIREVDLFAVKKTKIKRSFYFNHVDFGNDENSLLSIKSFVLENDISEFCKDCIAIKDMSSLRNLECLTLNQASLFDTSFQGLFRLESLDLINCDFENIKSESFRFVPNLEKVKIINPNNFNCEIFNELGKLNSLRLNGSFEMFEPFKNDSLETFQLEFENFDYFDGKKFLSRLPKLKTLIFGSISGIQSKLSSINLNYDFLSCLETLQFQNFQFPSFGIFSFSKLCNLKMLVLASCSTLCKSIRGDFFKGLGQLENLVIENSTDFFKEIPSTIFDDLENLINLSLGLNNLKNINPEWFSRMQKLECIDLWDNQISRVKIEMFTQLTNLTRLDLSHNQLNQLDDAVFSYLRNLENLSLSYNNYLRELKPQVFDGLDKLTYLDMRCLNEDFQLDVDLFQSLPSLKSVELDERFVEMIPELDRKYRSKIKYYFK